MLEIPEATTLARQINENLKGKIVHSVKAATSPHKFAWYQGDPALYPAWLIGNTILISTAWGGMPEIQLSHATLVFSDGVNLRLHPKAGPIPKKHQLLLEFNDGDALSASVQMYGGLLCWKEGEKQDNPYYLGSKAKPSPLFEDFDEHYFRNMMYGEDVQTLSAKAALATQQRIPGLGNGVLQDILWTAGVNPRRKMNTLNDNEFHQLLLSIKQTLAGMTRLGGRNTEKDLFGNPGGYQTVMCAANHGKPCPRCGTPIIKEAYLGGSVYTCGKCQPL